MRAISSVLAVLLMTVAPVSAVTFTENFDAGWSTAGNWSVEGVPNPGVPVTEFPAGDSRLDNNATRTAGGFWYERGISGDGSTFIGGDNEEMWLDYHMSVPNGTYTFNVSFDLQLKWDQRVQNFGQGVLMYMGDAADMAYGTILPVGNPTGPWSGITHWQAGGGDFKQALQGDTWNPGDSPDGQWTNWSFSQTLSLGSDWDPEIDVTSGEVIFRLTIRLKDKDQASPNFRSYAMDNLVINLVPEPTSLSLLALGSLALLRRRSW